MLNIVHRSHPGMAASRNLGLLTEPLLLASFSELAYAIRRLCFALLFTSQARSHMTTRKKWSIEDFHQIAEGRHGVCLSDRYLNMHTKLDFRCGVCGYEWSATPDSIVSGRWCRKCAARTPNNIKRGQWCTFCAGKTKWTIEAVNSLAKSRGGECLSKKYINRKEKLRFKCNVCGNVWKTSLASLLNGAFCPKCGLEKVLRQTRKTIGEMQQIATERGGECLSSTYVNSHTKLQWRCHKHD